MAIKSTNYCDIEAEGYLLDVTGVYKTAVERILVHESRTEEIRWAYYIRNKNGNYKLVVRPLDLTEDDLFDLIKEGIKKQVISDSLRARILQIIEKTPRGSIPTQSIKSTNYCQLIAAGEHINGIFKLCIERIHVKEFDNRAEIRFVYYQENPNGNYMLVTRPADFTIEQFLSALEKAIRNGVFTKVFLLALSNMLRKSA